MAYSDAGWPRQRLGAALAAGAIEAAAVVALVAGLAAAREEKERDTLAAVTLSVTPSPTPVPSPRPTAVREPEPEGRKGSALPREAPKAAIPMPAPPAAPTAQAGAAIASAPGESGTGSGAGHAGSGPGGGGGGGVPARRIGGALTDRDYPAAAARVRAAGSVAIRFVVGPDGRVRDCRVDRSSGYPMLDELTCRLVVQRFRYEPARNAEGKPVEDRTGTTFTWGTRD